MAVSHTSLCSLRSSCSIPSILKSQTVKNAKVEACLSTDFPMITNKCIEFSQTALFQRQSMSAKRSMFGLSKKSNSIKSSPVRMSLMGEDPSWNADDYIVLGLAHCFVKDDNSKLQDMFVIEPIPAGALECMDNGGVTCYIHATPTDVGTALKQDSSLLPPEFSVGKFCEDFEFRTLCASRTWKRQHPQENLMNLIEPGKVRSDWNFNVEDKRILNFIYEVNDADNIKQDLSIDVYGREKEEEAPSEIEKLYNA